MPRVPHTRPALCRRHAGARPRHLRRAAGRHVCLPAAHPGGCERDAGGSPGGASQGGSPGTWAQGGVTGGVPRGGPMGGIPGGAAGCLPEVQTGRVGQAGGAGPATPPPAGRPARAACCVRCGRPAPPPPPSTRQSAAGRHVLPRRTPAQCRVWTSHPPTATTLAHFRPVRPACLPCPKPELPQVSFSHESPCPTILPHIHGTSEPRPARPCLPTWQPAGRTACQQAMLRACQPACLQAAHTTCAEAALQRHGLARFPSRAPLSPKNLPPAPAPTPARAVTGGGPERVCWAGENPIHSVEGGWEAPKTLCHPL